MRPNDADIQQVQKEIPNLKSKLKNANNKKAVKSKEKKSEQMKHICA